MTKTEKIVDIAQSQGFIWLQQAFKLFNDDWQAKYRLRQLVKRGVLKEPTNVPERFDFIKPLPKDKNYKYQTQPGAIKNPIMMSSKKYRKHMQDIEKCRTLGDFC